MKTIKVLILRIVGICFTSISFIQFFSIQNISHPDVSACSSATEHMVAFQNNFGEIVNDIHLTVLLVEGLSFEDVTGGDFILSDGSNLQNLILVYSSGLGLVMI